MLSSIGKQFVRESLMGRRGLLKLNSLWFPLGLVFLAAGGLATPRPLFRLAVLTAAVLCWSLASTAANDLSEISEDRAAGKTRWMGMLPKGVARVVPVLFASGGLAVLVAAGAPAGTLAAYLVAVITGAIYSLRPLRLKERGAWGLAAYALSCSAANVLMPWTWYRGAFPMVPVLGAAVFLDKWVNLQFHQIVDHGEDSGQGMATYAVRAGLEPARRALRRFAAVASLALAISAAYAASAVPEIAVPVLIVTAGVLGLSGLHAVLSRRRPGLGTALSRELPWTYLGLTLGLFRAVPLVMFWEAALRAPSLRPAFIVVAVLLAADWVSSFRYRYE